MCGIVGQFYFDPSARVSTRDLTVMCNTIIHRGPDDEGIFASGPVGLGMRRLSIIDLAGGHQPMQSDDGRYTIVFNGEIYNYRDVKRHLESCGFAFRTASDTECILHAYAAEGVACLRRLNGMFAFAIWDDREQQLFVARDRVGVKPLYLYQDQQRLAFASEMKALLADASIPRSLDREAFSYFLRYGYVASPATLLRHIRQLPAAHYMLADRSGVTQRRYWSLGDLNPCSRPQAERAEIVHASVKQAVERQLVADVPLGAFLSGGLDSSSMVHFMAASSRQPVNTYAIGFSGADSIHNELEDARFVADHYRTNHHEIIVRPDAASLIPRLVDHLDQPLADSSFIVTYLVSELARGTVKVIISGVGGDEIFGGYRRYLAPHLDTYYAFVPPRIRRSLTSAMNGLPVDRGSAAKNLVRLGRSYITSHGLPPFERYDRAVQMLSPEAAAALSPEVVPSPSSLDIARREYFEQVSSHDPVGQMLRLDFHTSLVDSLLQLTDKMSMAASLEARVPLLDHELIETVAAMPSSAKISRGRLRLVQKQSMRGHLPTRVLKKKKRGFGCPVGAWFRTDLRALVNDTVGAAALADCDLLSAQNVQQLVNDHERQRKDHTDLLLALVTFQLWRGRWKVT